MSKQWLQQGERGSPLMLRTILWIALNVGRPAARLLLLPITLYFFASSSLARSASRRFLARAQAQPAGAANVFRHMHCFAATILDRIYLLGGRHDEFKVRFFGQEQLLDRVNAGQGCLLLGAHLGSFEILRAFGIEARHAPVKVLMYKAHNRAVTQLLDALNPQVAASVIDLGRPDCLLQAKEWVDKGGLLGLLGDRVVRSGKSVRCDFLGAPAGFPVGPLMLAATLDAPVLLMFGLYRGNRRYDVHIELFSEPMRLGREERAEALPRLVQAYADRVAHYAHLAPYNWFNFYDFWNENKRAA